jgi:uncharacterized protein YjiS (DUF1127 family)
METKMEMHSAKSLYAVHGLSAGATRPSRKGWLVRSLARAVRAIAAMRREMAYRRAIAELARLDPRLLADIGLGDSEIYSAVRCGRGELPALSRLQAGTEREQAQQRGSRPGERLHRPFEVRAGARC